MDSLQTSYGFRCVLKSLTSEVKHADPALGLRVPAELSGFSRKPQATVELGPGSQKSVIRSRKVAWRLPIRNEERRYQ
jgi:hypothetical protein